MGRGSEAADAVVAPEQGAGTGDTEAAAHHEHRVGMTVREARKFLKGCDQDAVLAICAHGFPGMEGQAWYVTHFAPVEDGAPIVLVEGAGSEGGGEH